MECTTPMPQPTPKPQKSRSQPKKKPFVITRRYEEILQAVHFYRFVRVGDIARLFFKETSRNYAGELLALLSGESNAAPGVKYLYRFPMPQTRKGQTEYIYTLGSEGRKYLKSLGTEVAWYFRPADYPKTEEDKAGVISYSHLKHATTLTSFLVAAEVFSRGNNEYELFETRIEYDLKSQATKIQLPIVKQGDTQTEEEIEWVVPDGWLNFYRDHHPYKPILLEIDRGTEMQKKFKRRIKGLTLFIQPEGHYKAMFGTNIVTVAFATTGNEQRLQTMLDWTQEALDEIKKPKHAASFRFCRLSPSFETKPETLFCAPVWYTPRTKEATSLLSS
jgi:hypothetical protein